MAISRFAVKASGAVPVGIGVSAPNAIVCENRQPGTPDVEEWDLPAAAPGGSNAIQGFTDGVQRHGGRHRTVQGERQPTGPSPRLRDVSHGLLRRDRRTKGCDHCVAEWCAAERLLAHIVHGARRLQQLVRRSNGDMASAV